MLVMRAFANKWMALLD